MIWSFPQVGICDRFLVAIHPNTSVTTRQSTWITSPGDSPYSRHRHTKLTTHSTRIPMTQEEPSVAKTWVFFAQISSSKNSDFWCVKMMFFFDNHRENRPPRSFGVMYVSISMCIYIYIYLRFLKKFCNPRDHIALSCCNPVGTVAGWVWTK